MSVGKQVLAVREIRHEIDVIDDYLTGNGLEEWIMKSRHGQRTLIGKTKLGETVRLSTYRSNGFSEQIFSRCSPLSPEQRRQEAKRLRKIGFTQTEIADRLGCSQKTISGDLRQ
jgi:DNA-directed RNA polymerase specialized sigma24 family protein